MSEIKVNSIKGVGASAAAITVNNTDGTCTANITNNLSNRNLIINGAMQVSQRGTSSTSSGFYTVDRLQVNFTGTNEAPTQAQVALSSSDTPYSSGFRFAYKVTNGNQTSGGGAGKFISYKTTIEAQDIAQSGWNYTSSSSNVTLSFWVKASVAQTYFGRLQTYDGTAQNYPFSFALSANTWTKVTKTIPGNSNLQFDNNNAEGLLLEIVPYYGNDYTNGSMSVDAWAAYSDRTPSNTATWYETDDATFEITGIQLEVGSVATDFEHRSFADELLKCQRYCYVLCEGLNTPLGNGTCWTASNVFIPVIYPVKMRSGPTMSVVTGTNYYSHFYGGTSANESGANFSLAVSLSTGCEIYDNSTNVTQNASCFSRNQNAACKITLSAEL